MAKGLRASTRKKNNAALRDRLFGPAVDARTERLSAKLQELAAKPRPDQDRVMELDDPKTAEKGLPSDAKDDGEFKRNDFWISLTVDPEMDVDASGVKMKPVKRDSKKHTLGKTQKKIAKRKSKKSIVFPDIKAKWRRQAAQKRKK